MPRRLQRPGSHCLSSLASCRAAGESHLGGRACCVNAAVGAIRNDAQLDDIDTGSTLVTEDNLDDEDVKAVLDPSCSNKPEVSGG